MRSAARWRMAAVIAFMTACGPATAPVGNVTSSPVASASASPSPAPTPAAACDAAHRCLALVTLRGGNATIVRDVTDISHPATVGSLGMNPVAKFISASDVSYVGGDGLVRAPLAGSPAAKVAVDQTYITSPFDWSPDGATLMYLTGDPSSAALHTLSAGQARVLAPSLPGIPAVGCESQACAGADTWDLSLTYARDGSAVALVVNLPGRNVFRIWTPDGKVVDASDSKGRFMSVWSGNSLYFRDASGVNVWRNGAVSTFLPGLAWIAPKASPAGGQIVYATKDAQGWHHVFVVDTSTHAMREIKARRSSPTFLTSRYLWYSGEASPGVSSAKTYIYDLQTGAEYESIITQVFDTWPHAA